MPLAQLDVLMAGLDGVADVTLPSMMELTAIVDPVRAGAQRAAWGSAEALAVASQDGTGVVTFQALMKAIESLVCAGRCGADALGVSALGARAAARGGVAIDVGVPSVHVLGARVLAWLQARR